MAPHPGESGFRNDYPHPAKESFWRRKWEQLANGVVAIGESRVISPGGAS